MNLDVVAIPQASKLLLTSCVPYVEPVATVSGTILFVQFRTHSIQWLFWKAKFSLSVALPDGATVGVEDQRVHLWHSTMEEIFQNSNLLRKSAKLLAFIIMKIGFTSTPRVATYFFSNSPVRWRFTKVVFPEEKSWISRNDTTTTQLMSLFVVGEPTSASIPHQHQLEGGHVFACCHLGVESNICNFGNWNHTVTSIPLKQSVNCSETRISQYCVTNQLLLTRNSLDKTTVATR